MTFQKWLEFGIGGYRLDVADELPDFFLQKLRKSVKESNENAFRAGYILNKNQIDKSVTLAYQTLDKTALENIGRKNLTLESFAEIDAKFTAAGVPTYTELILGLPGETFDDLKNTVDFFNKHNIQGLKIHSTYVVKNTVLADMFFAGQYEPISLDYYLDALTYVVTHISPNIVIHRISGDSPKDLLVAPEWNLHKKWILNGFDKILREKDLWQGKYYKY